MSANARAWAAAGLEALRRGQPDKAVRAFDKALALEAEPRTLLLRARALRASGRDAEASEALESVAASVDAESRVDAALEFASLGEAWRAVALARGVLREAPAHRRALEIVAAHAPRIGWAREACVAMDALCARKDSSSALEAHAARLYESLRDLPRALQHAERARALDASSVQAALVVARVAARAGDREAATSAASRAAQLAGHEPRLLRDAAEALLAAGAPQEAERIFLRVLDLDREDFQSLAWVAELALWRNDLERADALATEVLARDERNARAWAARGSVLVERGQHHDALALLDRALSLAHDDVAAHHARGIALRELGRFVEAVEAIDLAILHASRYAVTAHASRLITVMTEAPSEHRLQPDTYRELVHTLVPLGGPLDDATREGQPAAVLDYLRRALREAGANRSELVTRLVPGGLEGIDVRPNSRTACRYAQESLRTRELAEVLAAFDTILAEYGELPTIYCHRGEVFVWFGRHEEGEADFERALALDPKTRWAWIGLAAARLMRGALTGAREAFELALVHAPPPGRTIHVYRGELALVEGRLADAREDLARALHMNPERISATLLLSLVSDAEGDAGACELALRDVGARAPGLLASMAPGLAQAPAPERVRTLLAMMRGNRSAGFVTYFANEGGEEVIRFVPPPDVVAVRA